MLAPVKDGVTKVAQETKQAFEDAGKKIDAEFAKSKEPGGVFAKETYVDMGHKIKEVSCSIDSQSSFHPRKAFRQHGTASSFCPVLKGSFCICYYSVRLLRELGPNSARSVALPPTLMKRP